MSSGANASEGSSSQKKGKDKQKQPKAQPNLDEQARIKEARRLATKGMATMWTLRDRRNELAKQLGETDLAISKLEKELGYTKEPTEMTQVIWDAAEVPGKSRSSDLKRKYDELDDSTEENKKRKKGLAEKFKQHKRKARSMQEIVKGFGGLSIEQIIEAVNEDVEEEMAED